ncbi:MAG: hypothetical protein Q7S13_05050 [Candidatus Omnitrophota bacterium]|jgi:cellulose synthase/poly-beta-1,6-N-acetylglucosamine synthase-like glycosyltransferase|nr:hypothetical protein [Candidatus Omnitrophota bacterium]
MPSLFKRNVYTNVNQYQARMLWPVLLCCCFACIFIILFLFSLVASLTEAKEIFSIKMVNIKALMPWIVIVISFCLILIAVLGFHISNKILGGSERIIRELDIILEGKSKNPITSRQGDELLEELLKRINALIERVP